MTRLEVAILCLSMLVLAAGCSAQAGYFNDLSPKWHKDGKDVLKGFNNLYQPHVVHEPGAEYPFKMWFFGWCIAVCNPGYPGCDAIFHARAKQLDQWEVYAGEGKWDTTMNPAIWVPVLTAQNTFYDSWHNGDPSVVRKDGLYHMLYSSTGFDRDRIPFGQPGDTDGDLYCIMGATSPDGIHWAKSRRPLLIYQPDIGLRGIGDYDVTLFGMYHRPSLMFDEGKWKCWFDYWSGQSAAMGYAECPADSFLEPVGWRVIRAGEHPLQENWPNPDVVKVAKKYYSYSDPGGFGPHPWIGRRICEAVSDDGIIWKVLGNIPPESDTPATHVPEAFVMQENGRNKIIVFYTCQVGGEPYRFEYDRIRFMWRYE